MRNQENITLGIFYALICFFFDSMTAIGMKWLGSNYHFIQVIFLKNFIALVCLMVYFKGSKKKWNLRTSRLHHYFFNFALAGLATICFIIGLKYIQLSEFAALCFTNPFFIFVLSIFFLGEKVSFFRLIAVLIGFSGVLFIIQPGTEAFSIYSVIVFIGVFFMAGSIVSAKILVFYEDAPTMMYHFKLIGSVAYIPFLPFIWVTPSLLDFAVFIVFALASFGMQYFTALALSKAPAVVVAPMEYSTLLWNIFWGYLIWREVPSTNVVSGALIIISAGLFLIYRDYMLSKNKLNHAKGTT